MNTCVTNVPLQREAHLLTVNQSKRRSDILMRHIDDLHAVMKTVKGTHPLKDGHIRASRQAKRERSIWQRRYWEHQSGMSINVLTIDTQMAMLRVSIVYALRGEFHAQRRHQPTCIARATRFN